MDPKNQNFIDVNPVQGANVIFWGVDVTRNELKKDEGDKVRHFDVHPVNSWVLAVDRDDEVYVWDFAKNDCIFHKSMTQLLSNAEIGSRRLNVNDSVSNGQVFNDKIINNGRYYITSNSSSMYNTYQYSSSLFDDIILGTAVKKSLFSGVGSITEADTEEGGNSNAAKVTNVKLIKFIDESCLCNDTLDNNLLHRPPTFHTPTQIMIVCDMGVIFHNFLSNSSITASHSSSTRIITVASLNNKIPTSAEFIFNSICAIGCSDGIIRIWDCLKWCEIKQFNAHGKGDVLAIKSLPILRHNYDTRDGSSCQPVYERVHSTVSGDKGGSVIRQGRIRILTIGSDSSAYIWDSGITGNIIEIDGRSPTSRLDGIGASSTSVCNSTFLNEENNMLFTLSADHIVRLWDLDLISDNSNNEFSKSEVSGNRIVSTKSALNGNASQSKSKGAFSSSFFKASRSNHRTMSSANDSDGFTAAKSTSGTLGNNILSCCGKLKVSGSTFPQPLLSKMTSFKQFVHPRYHSDTYLVAAKTNQIALVTSSSQAGFAAGGTLHRRGSTSNNMSHHNSDAPSMSERSDFSDATRRGAQPQSAAGTAVSDPSRADKAVKVQAMHILNLNVLMASYFQHLKSTLGVGLMMAATDPSIKIYKVTPHPLHTQLVVLATSIGVLVINVCPIKPGPYIGTHARWGAGSVLSVSSGCRLELLSVAAADSDADTSDAPLTITKHTVGGASEEQSRSNRRRSSIKSYDDIVDNMSYGVSANSIQSEVITSLHLANAQSLVTSSPSKAAKLSSSQTSNDSSHVDSFEMKMSRTRPIVLPCPSGRYCALVWQESHIFIIVRIKFCDSAIGHSSATKLSEHDRVYDVEGMETVERGYCLSFAWVTNHSSSSSSSSTSTENSEADMYAVLERGKRVMNIVKSKGLMSGLSFRGKTEEEEGEFLPPAVVFKHISGAEQLKSSASPKISNLIVGINKEVVDIEQPSALFSGPLMCITSLRKVFSKSHANNNPANLSNNNSMLTTASIHSSTSIASTPDTSGKPSKATAGLTASPSKGNLPMKSTSINALLAAQQIANKQLEEGVGGDNLVAEYTLKSQFFRVINKPKLPSPPVATTASKANKEVLASSVVELELVLEPVGAAMPPASAVVWDSDSSQAAVLIHTRINILRLQLSTAEDKPAEMTKPNAKKAASSLASAAAAVPPAKTTAFVTKLELVTIASVDMAQCIYMSPIALHWQSGVLYASSAVQVWMIATEYPFNMYSTNTSSGDSNNNSVERSDMKHHVSRSVSTADISVDVISLASRDYTTCGLCASRFRNASAAASTAGSAVAVMDENSQSLQHPLGYYAYPSSGACDVAGIQNGHVILATSYTSVPLVTNPLATILYLLSQSQLPFSTSHQLSAASAMSGCPYITRAVEWAKLLPCYLHDTAALIFAKRRLFREALLLPHLTKPLTKDIQSRMTNIPSAEGSINTIQTGDDFPNGAVSSSFGGYPLAVVDRLLSQTSAGAAKYTRGVNDTKTHSNREHQ